MKKLTVIALAIILLASCRMPEGMPQYKEAFMNRNDYCLLAGSKEMIDFSSGEPQASYNPTTKIYRCSALSYTVYESDSSALETVEEYYNVILSANISGTVGQKISSCKIILHTDALQTTKEPSQCGEIEVVKVVDDKAWLWSESLQWGLVVKFAAKQP